jgi:hypothetical protein
MLEFDVDRFHGSGGSQFVFTISHKASTLLSGIFPQELCAESQQCMLQASRVLPVRITRVANVVVCASYLASKLYIKTGGFCSFERHQIASTSKLGDETAHSP